MKSLGLQIEQHEDAYSLSVANDSSDSIGTQFSGQKAFGATNQANKEKNGIAGRYFDGKNKKDYAEGLLCRNHFAFEVLAGKSPAEMVLDSILNKMTNSSKWALNVSSSMQAIGVNTTQQATVLSTLSNINSGNTLNISTLSSSDTPEIAAQKLAIANPDIFAINPQTSLPLKAGELANSCSTPEDISGLCGGQGLSQDHAILLLEAMHIDKIAPQMTPKMALIPKTWEPFINAPAPAGMH